MRQKDTDKFGINAHNRAQVIIANDNSIVYATQNNSNYKCVSQQKFGGRNKGYGINEAIPYKWTFGWTRENMTNPEPIVNSLLKAIIERDISRMESLYQTGASLAKSDKETFQRILFYVIDDYDTINWLINHGMTSTNTRDCIGVDGYIWGLLARAWYVKAYAVMELLAYYGFDWLIFCINGKGFDARRMIFEKDDIRAMKILKEHGFIEDVDYELGFSYSTYRREYPESKVTAYLNENPIIKRKSVGLDNYKFRKIPQPELEKENIFNRKKVRERNEIKMADYNDRVRAQKEYLKVFQAKNT